MVPMRGLGSITKYPNEISPAAHEVVRLTPKELSDSEFFSHIYIDIVCHY